MLYAFTRSDNQEVSENKLTGRVKIAPPSRTSGFHDQPTLYRLLLVKNASNGI